MPASDLDFYNDCSLTNFAFFYAGVLVGEPPQYLCIKVSAMSLEDLLISGLKVASLNFFFACSLVFIVMLQLRLNVKSENSSLTPANSL